MYRFDEHENRIYRIQHGLQRIGEVAVSDQNLIDLDVAEAAVRKTILDLNEKSVRS